MMVPSSEYTCENCGRSFYTSGGLFYALPYIERHCPDCNSTELEATGTIPQL